MAVFSISSLVNACTKKTRSISYSIDVYISIPTSKRHGCDAVIKRWIRFKQSGGNALGSVESAGFGSLSAAVSATKPFSIACVFRPGDKIGKNRPFYISTAEPLTVTSGLLAWYDAASIPSGTTTVSSWPDSSGNGYAATQSNDSKKPIYMPDGFLGHPCLYFDGKDDMLSLPTFSMSTDSMSAFVVGSIEGPNMNSPFTNNTFIETSYGWYLRVAIMKTQGNTDYKIQAAVQKTNYKSAESGYVYRTGYGHIISAIVSGTNLKLWVDGDLINENNTVDAGNLGTSGGLIGSRDGGSSSGYINAKIAEVILYSRALSDTERLAVEDYLSRKYGFADPFGAPVVSTFADYVVPSDEMEFITMIYGNDETLVYRNGRTIANHKFGSQSDLTHIHVLGNPLASSVGEVANLTVINRALTHGEVIGLERYLYNLYTTKVRKKHRVRAVLKGLGLTISSSVDAVISKRTSTHRVDVMVRSRSSVSSGIDAIIDIKTRTSWSSVDALIPSKSIAISRVRSLIKETQSASTIVFAGLLKKSKISSKVDTDIGYSPKNEPDGLYHRNWSGQSGPWRAVVINFTWAETEPTQGNYDWTAVNNAINSSPVPVRLRPRCGKDSPQWVKNLVGTFTYIEPQSGDVVDMPNIWSTTYQQKVSAWYQAMANQFDNNPKVVTVFAAGGMTYYAEPFIRGTSDPTNRQNMLAVGYTTEKDKQLLRDQLTWMSGWKRTRIGLAYNPWQYITSSGGSANDTVFMEEVMTLHMQMFGVRATLQNNSLRSSWIVNNSWPAGYARLYDLLWLYASAGQRVTLQLAAASRVGDEELCIRYAASNGADGIEVSNTLTHQQYASLQNELWPI